MLVGAGVLGAEAAVQAPGGGAEAGGEETRRDLEQNIEDR